MADGSGGESGGDPPGAGAGAGLGGATTGSSGARLGCGWILSISRFASSQASKFCDIGLHSARDVWSFGERTFLHHSWWILDIAIHISRISATFCLWNRSKSAWIVDDAYFKSCAETCSASSNYSPSVSCPRYHPGNRDDGTNAPAKSTPWSYSAGSASLSRGQHP